MKKITVSLLELGIALAMVIMLTACGKGSGSPAAAAGGGSATAKWTFMVYMDADNDLDPYSQADLNEMMAVGSSANVTVLVQYDGYGPNTPALRYKVEKGSLTKLADLGEINTASGDTLRDFITFGINNYPADHYSLVLWDHGNGWKTGSTRPIAKSILTDWTSNGNKSAELANYYVAKGIKEAADATGVKLDIIGIDACIMATIEAVYDFRNLAGFFVSSQDLVQVAGWDYKDLLTRLAANPSMLPQDLAWNMVDSYKNYVEARSFTDQALSALRLGSGIDTLATAVDNMAHSLKTNLDAPGSQSATLSLLTTTRGDVQAFDPFVNVGSYVDLLQLSQLLAGTGNAVQTAIQNITVNEYHGSSRSGAHGISIVFFDIPQIFHISDFLNFSIYDPDYINLQKKRAAPISFLDNFLSWPQLLNDYYNLQYHDNYVKLQNWPAQ